MDRAEGIINLLKPAGMTSHDAVTFLRRLTGERKIGHTGTLDPMAVGVLPLCLGNATRVIEYMDKDEKAYRCEVLLGLETDTQDVWGQVLQDRRSEGKLPFFDELNEVLLSFEGDILQVPPQYSAIKIQGRPVYRYARDGQEVELPARPVTIRECRLISYQRQEGRAMFDVVCSKGTYIRSVCRDLGERLGCGGTMSFLVRRRSGPFALKDAITLEELTEQWQRYILPIDYALDRFGILTIPESRRKWFRNGGYLRRTDVEIKEESERDRNYRVYCSEEFMGTVVYSEKEKLYLADKVFNR